MSERLSEAKGLSKWQLALAIGLPLAAVVALGGAILAYSGWKRSNRAKPPVEDGEATLNLAPAGGVAGDGRPKASTTQSAASGSNSTVSTLERARDIKQRGNVLYKEQKFEEAIRCYEQAIEVCPNERKEDIAIFHQNIAAVYEAMAARATDESDKTSHQNSVLHHCTCALEKNPRYIKAITRRIKVLEAFGQKKELLLDVTRVLLLDESQGRQFADTIAKLLKSMGTEQAIENFAKLDALAPTQFLADLYFDSFLWKDDLSEEKLRKLWNEVVKPKTPDQSAAEEQSHDPQDELIVPTDQSEVVNGSHDEAESSPDLPNQSETTNGSHDETDESEITPFEEQPFVEAAKLFQAKKYFGLIELLTNALEKGHAVFRGHVLLLRGALYALWRQDELGLKDLQEVVNSHGLKKEMYVDALLKRAGIFMGQGSHEKATTCFEKAIAISPGSPDVYILRGRQAEFDPDNSVEQLNSSLTDLEKAVKMAPHSAHAAYSLASSYYRMAALNQSMQLIEMAQMKFEEALLKFPDYYEGLVQHAMFLQDLGNYQKAEETYNKIIKHQPENPLAHFSLGLLTMIYRHDLDKAVVCMEKSIAVDSSCVQAYLTLAPLELQRGNKERAFELYERAAAFVRSQVELSQVYVAREMMSAQDRACRELGIVQSDLTSRSFPAGM